MSCCRIGSSRSRHRVTIKGRVQGRFDSDELERAVKEIIVRQGLAESVPAAKAAMQRMA